MFSESIQTHLEAIVTFMTGLAVFCATIGLAWP
jgi:hypothetical protein